MPGNHSVHAPAFAAMVQLLPEEIREWGVDYLDDVDRTLRGILAPACQEGGDYDDLLFECQQVLCCYTFPQAYKRREELGDRVRAYLNVSARRAAKRLLAQKAKHHRRFRTTEAQFLAESEDRREGPLDLRIIQALVRQAVDQLPPKQREAIKCCCLSNEPTKHFASRHNITASAVNTRIRKGRQKLKTILGKWGLGPEGSDE